MSLSDLASLDPTGTLSAATSAIKLVGKIAQVAPALKNAGNGKSQAGGPNPLQRSTTAPGGTIAPIRKDPERERRAYETVNFVLREFGSRLCAAGLVNEHALTKALVAASQHVDVKLFSGEANRLFASLAPKLADPLLVNSIFTAIYFIGVVVTELTRSLPNYKDTHTHLGPKLVQQLFRTAIGEDAFRENLGANLDAYETLATTAGLLRPTDPDYSTFPGFPAFSASRYSGRSLNETWSNKFAFEKLCKHFQRVGFPQPTKDVQAEIGIIGDWRFLMSDTNTQAFNIDKADKHIGENFGRVIYWLVCSADRLPPGQAIIVYYDQHIELIRWIGARLGYRILQPAVDLDLTGPHTKLDGRLKSIVNSWLVLVFSESARAAKQAASEKWNEERAAAARKLAQAAPGPVKAANSPVGNSVPSQPASAGPPATSSQPTAIDRRVSMVPTLNQPLRGIEIQSVEVDLNRINQWFNTQLKPQCQVFIKMPPSNARARELEAKRLADLTEQEIFIKLNALPIPDGHSAQVQREAMIEQARKMLATVDAFAQTAEHSGSSDKIPISPMSIGSISPVSQSADLRSPFIGSAQTTPLTSPPPYSPGSVTLAAAAPSTTKIRRKAPPPPRKPTAKALYDFTPEEGDDEELTFREGDELEIVEKTAELEEEGWCKAKIKGTTKIGLAPLEYLEIAPVPTAVSLKPSTSNASSAVGPTKVQPSPNGQSYFPPTSPLAANATQHTAASVPVSQSQTAEPAASQHPPKSDTPQGPIEVKNKLSAGGKAGLAIAGVGTAAGVAALIQSQRGDDTVRSQTQTTQSQQQPAHCPQDQTNNTDQDARRDTDHQPQDGTQNDQTGLDQSVISPENTTTYTTDTTTTSDLYYDTSSGPFTDLSALDGGFQPDPALSGPNPMADLATVDPYFAAQNPDLVAAPDSDSVLATQEPALSPFAAFATPTVDPGYVGVEGPVSPFAGVAGDNAPVLLTDDVVVVEPEYVSEDLGGLGEAVAVEEVAVEYDAGDGDDDGGFDFE